MILRNLESLYDRHAEAVFAFALRLTRDRYAAEDLTQTVFCNLAKKQRFTIWNARSFLLRCLYRAYVDSVRRSSVRAAALDRYATEPFVAPDADESSDPEKVSMLLESLATLPEDQRVIVHLKVWEKKTFAEMAGILGISPNTAASRYRYGLDKLKTTMRLEK
jgi:RNA polymerase sigma-70 factor (ECF subfamily)